MSDRRCWRAATQPTALHLELVRYFPSNVTAPTTTSRPLNIFIALTTSERLRFKASDSYTLSSSLKDELSKVVFHPDPMLFFQCGLLHHRRPLGRSCFADTPPLPGFGNAAVPVGIILGSGECSFAGKCSFQDTTTVECLHASSLYRQFEMLSQKDNMALMKHLHIPMAHSRNVHPTDNNKRLPVQVIRKGPRANETTLAMFGGATRRPRDMDDSI